MACKFGGCGGVDGARTMGCQRSPAPQKPDVLAAGREMGGADKHLPKQPARREGEWASGVVAV